MVLHMYIANKRYSSWSMRPWVLLKALNIPFEEHLHTFKANAAHQPEFLSFSPTAKVPCLHDSSNSIIVWDSLAICEYIAETHAGVWPKDPTARAFARCAAAEMHSGFNSIRNECSMNVALRIDMGSSISDALQREITRLSELFNQGLTTCGGPWLAGDSFTAVDAFFAPIASRVKTYGLQLDGPSAQYAERLFEHPAVQEWVRDGIKEKEREPAHEEDCVAGGRKIVEDLSI